jgi:N-acylglucosamine 2-epimerase
MSTSSLAAVYRDTLLDDVMPFWLRHGMDREPDDCSGCPHRDGRVSQTARGNMFKGPFHLPRMLWYCWKLLDE